jgi:hypothetical protein
METCTDFRNIILEIIKITSSTWFLLTMSEHFIRTQELNCEILKVGCLSLTGIELEKTAWRSTA